MVHFMKRLAGTAFAAGTGSTLSLCQNVARELAENVWCLRHECLRLLLLRARQTRRYGASVLRLAIANCEGCFSALHCKMDVMWLGQLMVLDL